MATEDPDIQLGALMGWRAADTWVLFFGVAILLGMGGYLVVHIAGNSSLDPAILLLGATFLISLGLLLGSLWWVYFRTRVSLEDQRLSLIVPTWRGQFPTPPMRQFAFGPGQLRGVEIRQEVRRSMGDADRPRAAARNHRGARASSRTGVCRITPAPCRSARSRRRSDRRCAARSRIEG